MTGRGRKKERGRHVKEKWELSPESRFLLPLEGWKNIPDEGGLPVEKKTKVVG